MFGQDCCLTSYLAAGLVCLVAYLVIRSKRILRYFKDRGIPGPEPMLFFGNTWGTWRRPVLEIEIEQRKKYGPVYGSFEGHRPSLTISDPAMLRNILVKDFDHFRDRRSFKELFPADGLSDKFLSVVSGEEWKGIRSLVSPAFSTGKLKKMVELMQDCGQNLVKHFKKRNEEGKPIVVKDLFGGFTLDVIATCAFGTKLDSLGKEDDPFVIHAKKMLQNDAVESPAIVLVFVVPKLLIRVVGRPFAEMMSKTMTFYRRLVEDIICERKGEPSGRGDFLDLLLDEKKKANEGSGEEGSLKQKVATTDVITSQSILFFLAGFDTAATLLTWITYELAVHPEIQDKLYEEVKEKLKEHGGFTYDMISDLSYMDMVVNETLRLRSPAIRLERECTKEIEYDGMKIEKGMLIKIPVTAIHMDENNYPDPEEFRPERFSSEAKAARDQYTFVPFGQGPRNCVGMRFALEEVKTGLAHLISELRFVTTPDTKITLIKGALINMPKNLVIGVEARHQV